MRFRSRPEMLSRADVRTRVVSSRVGSLHQRDCMNLSGACRSIRWVCQTNDAKVVKVTTTALADSIQATDPLLLARLRKPNIAKT